MQTAAREWSVWSTTARVVVTDPACLNRASVIVADLLTEVGNACSRFEASSEVNRLHAALPGGVDVSPLLAQLVSRALDAARHTHGDVDPTLGNALSRLGYDRDISELPVPRIGTTAPAGTAAASTAAASTAAASRSAAHTSARTPSTATAPTPVITLATSIAGWRRVSLDGLRLTVPADLALDLGATAKAVAADLAAARVSEELGCGVLVGLGGDIKTSGVAPEGGWQITVEDLPGDPVSHITLAAGQALATSSTQKRRWLQSGRAMHHILDPARGLPAAPVWRTVTVAAPSCFEANMLSTASVVRGYRAMAWLAQRGSAARLVTADCRVLTLGGWPDDDSVRVRAVG